MIYYNQTPAVVARGSGIPVVYMPSNTFTPSILAKSPTTASFPYEGMVAFWTFGGNSNDVTGNGHNGTDTKVGYGLYFAPPLASETSATGSIGTASISISNQITGSVANGPFTVAGWAFVYPGANSTVNIWNWGNRKATFSWGEYAPYPGANGNHYVQYVITSGSTVYSASTEINERYDGWYHIAVVRDIENSHSIYINAQTTGAYLGVKQNNIDGKLPNIGNSPQGMLSGSDTGFPFDPSFSTIALKSIGVWNRALSAAEIALLYTTGSTP